MRAEELTPEEKRQKPEWQLFFESLPEEMTLEELRKEYRSSPWQEDIKISVLRAILKEHEKHLPTVHGYYVLAMEKFSQAFAQGVADKDENEYAGKTMLFDIGKTEFRDDGVMFYPVQNVSNPLPTEFVVKKDEIEHNAKVEFIKSKIFHTNEEITPDGLLYLMIAKVAHTYIQRTAILRHSVEKEVEFYEGIIKQRLTSSTPERGAMVVPISIKQRKHKHNLQ